MFEQGRITMGANGIGSVQFGPDLVNVVFYARQMPDPLATQQTGIPQFKAVDYVRVQHPGETDYTDSPVDDKPYMVNRYPGQWQAYQQSKEYVPEGTPIEMLFPQHAQMAIAGTLRSLGVHTVQQLAALTDEGRKKVGLNAQEYMNHAKKYLDTAGQGVAYHKLQKELTERDNKIEVLENNIKLLQSQLNHVMAVQAGTAQQSLVPFSAMLPIAQQALIPTQQATTYSMPSLASASPNRQPVVAEVLYSAPGQPVQVDPPKKPRGRPPGSRNKTPQPQE